ncbi:hypothetical protein DSO57_1038216 [Entomophthora muscae]|uniref:Uncharacterized protein n=1 Tax=Entomophthora muscae TaxID=34485 RepID=A0ACC2RDJ3_9FUNG|nr:hypothetical protein DSO57_1038216 [Entomophthora muscae]
MYFKSIDDAKVSVSHMTPNQLLRRDFKLWTTPISNRHLELYYQLGSKRLVSDHLAKELPQMSELGLIPTSISTQPGFLSMIRVLFQLPVKSISHFRDLLDEIPASKPQ